jgi:hypothetical protein
VIGGIFLGCFLENLQDTGKDLNITRKDRGQYAKQRGLFSYHWTPVDRELQAVGGAGDWNGYGLGQGGEKGEEIEGMLGRCSPRHRRGEAAGNPRQPKTGAAARGSRVAAIRRSSGVRSVLDRRGTSSHVSW